ncbi:hypothetical protein FEA48_14830 [Pseudomonas nitroreducens]|uniref:Uncharacterized protein n=1 Tax=Pseudomonas nitroreducens TaxID=46680 RepID=A0A5R9A647_PSENT|nr:hypothetical protein [Pseudomonas nitroreducens]TLP73515.1 hypothetical protein FEA48_14830 [Pseudomonas nitroreducens]
MFGPDALSQFFGTLLLALAFSAFILFVRGYRPQGVDALWYDLALVFIGLWLTLWPELGHYLRSMSIDSAIGLLAELLATLLGGVLGAGVAYGLRQVMGERRRGKRRND